MIQIIKSMADNDLYKLSMGQAVFNQLARVMAGFDFINRGGTIFPDGFAQALREQIDLMGTLALTEAEAAFIKARCYFLSPAYIEWFRGYRFDPSQVTVSQENGDLKVHIEGPWYQTIFWEVPLMATISELYYQMMGLKPSDGYLAVAKEKGSRFLAEGIKVADFGTRRRFSLEVHRNVLIALKEQATRPRVGLVGTSNLMLAHELDLTPIGTYAHEWVMGNAALFGYRMADRAAMDAWVKEFNAQLGTALSDTYTTDAFLQWSFGPFFAKLFDGVRQDSGDPIRFIGKMVDHYRKLRIDPATKTLVFSDGLTVDKAVEIARTCKANGVGCSFGIGTHLTNDVGVTPLNIVIKASWFETERLGRIPVCKLSDDPGKRSGDPIAIRDAVSELMLERR